MASEQALLRYCLGVLGGLVHSGIEVARPGVNGESSQHIGTSLRASRSGSSDNFFFKCEEADSDTSVAVVAENQLGQSWLVEGLQYARVGVLP